MMDAPSKYAPMNSERGFEEGMLVNPLMATANIPYLNQTMEFSSSGNDLNMWPSQQQMGAMVNPMHLTAPYNVDQSNFLGNMPYPSMHMAPMAPSFVTNNSMMTIKVPMVPWRAGSSTSLPEDRPLAPLMLPFHHKNDNSIIPQTFGASGLGSHGLPSSFLASASTHPMAHGLSSQYSVEELQRSKDLFIAKAGTLDFSNITVVELKNFLKDFGLAPGGKKDDLIARIKQIKDYLINEQKGLLSNNPTPTENPFIIYGSNSFFPTTTTML